MTQEDLLKQTTEQQVAYWIGRMLVAIGSGSFKSEVYLMMDFYSRVGYERGVASVKDMK